MFSAPLIFWGDFWFAKPPLQLKLLRAVGGGQVTGDM